ncbi:MAG: M23 family metallopeptidase [Leptolyngbya sp.]|nr:M23 family metallopeptidase [Candidatus Melainabacteria bacterium]
MARSNDIARIFVPVLLGLGGLWLPSVSAAEVKASARANPAKNAVSSEVKKAPEAEISDEQVASAISDLRTRHLLVPIDGIPVERFKGSFFEIRGETRHEATDIAAVRNTPVRAVEDGTIEKLFLSKLGGNTIYQTDPSKKYVYYYAHLEGYEPSLTDGAKIKRGDIIGYVGTSGNAPPNSPHLHFSISILTPEKKWWKARALDAYEVYKPK